MADAFRLTRDRFSVRFLPAEQIVVALKADFGEQSGHCAGMRLEPSVRQGMRDINSTLVEFMSDEKRPVAVKRLFLRAHQRNAAFLCATPDPLQALSKERRLRETVVTDAAALVTRWIVGPPSRLATETHVPDTGSLKQRDESFAVEMGSGAAAGRGTHVRDSGHPMPGQKVEKQLQRVVGVTDREDCVRIPVHVTTARQVR